MKRYLITSALPYASGVTHLGNIVGSTLPADIFARYCRLAGRETLYVCGSDEHGVAITIAADTEGVSPQQLIDKYHAANVNAFRRTRIDFDVFDRTSNPIHAETAREFFLCWHKDGLLTERDEEQFFDEDAGIFLPDRYVEGVCPNCGHDRARGDQCESCGAYYNQLDLKQPRSLLTGKTPVVRSTKHWYFRLDLFQSWAEQYIESHAGKWKENVLQQSRSWLKQGLAERAATRDMSWGISVPLQDAQGKVLYVWFEAVLGYISATKQWAIDRGEPNLWRTWWLSKDTEYTAFLGKDNIVFHAIIFPILLHSRADEQFVLPENVPANEFLNLEGRKFSKSRNWAIDLLQFLEAFPEPWHADALRYVLAVNMPETKDSDFTWRDFQAKVNNELAAILGNYVNRTLQFAHRNFRGQVPSIDESITEAWNNAVENGIHQSILTEHENALAVSVHSGLKSVADLYDRFRFRDAALETMNIARAANKFFNDEAPWLSIKTDSDKCARTVFLCLNLVKTLSAVFAPILPNTAERIGCLLGHAPISGSPGEMIDLSWMDSGRVTLKAGAELNDPVILFGKIEDEIVEREQNKLNVGGGFTESEVEHAPLIGIDDFTKVELKTARIVSAEKLPKSKKLLRLNVDIGGEVRQVVAGIAEYYDPLELIDKTVVLVSNLRPAKLMGVESQGMVLAARDEGTGRLVLIQPMSPIAAGSVVK